LGVSEDAGQALQWYRRAAGQGYSKARQAVEQLTGS